MCGGDAAVFERIAPTLRHYGVTVALIGGSGTRQLTKMVNQIAIAGVVQGLSEALHFGQRAGLDMQRVLQVIGKGAAASWQMDNRGKTMIEGRFDFGLAVDWMRKELAICLEEARRNGASLSVTALIDQLYGDVQALGGQRYDTSTNVRITSHREKFLRACATMSYPRHHARALPPCCLASVDAGFSVQTALSAFSASGRNDDVTVDDGSWYFTFSSALWSTAPHSPRFPFRFLSAIISANCIFSSMRSRTHALSSLAWPSSRKSSLEILPLSSFSGLIFLLSNTSRNAANTLQALLSRSPPLLPDDRAPISLSSLSIICCSRRSAASPGVVSTARMAVIWPLK